VSFLAYVQLVFAAALTARKMTHAIFLSSVGGAAAALLLGIVLTRELGIYGALIGLLCTGAVINGMLWRSYLKGLHTGSEPGRVGPVGPKVR
jgi:O-antigen/teichoic acid export membrane protein